MDFVCRCDSLCSTRGSLSRKPHCLLTLTIFVLFNFRSIFCGPNGILSVPIKPIGINRGNIGIRIFHQAVKGFSRIPINLLLGLRLLVLAHSANYVVGNLINSIIIDRNLRFRGAIHVCNLNHLQKLIRGINNAFREETRIQGIHFVVQNIDISSLFRESKFTTIPTHKVGIICDFVLDIIIHTNTISTQIRFCITHNLIVKAFGICAEILFQVCKQLFSACVFTISVSIDNTTQDTHLPIGNLERTTNISSNIVSKRFRQGNSLIL